MRLSDKSAGRPDRDPVGVINAALDMGVVMVDTADAYQNEELIGRAIQGRRGEVMLASKFGLVWRDEIAGGFDVRADPAYIHQACEASLRRLGVDVIDLYYLHHRSEGTPIEETVGAMAELVKQVTDCFIVWEPQPRGPLRWRKSPLRTRPHRGKSHWPGCIIDNRYMECPSSQSPGRAASLTFGRTSRRLPSTCPMKNY